MEDFRRQGARLVPRGRRVGALRRSFGHCARILVSDNLYRLCVDSLLVFNIDGVSTRSLSDTIVLFSFVSLRFVSRVQYKSRINWYLSKVSFWISSRRSEIQLTVFFPESSCVCSVLFDSLSLSASIQTRFKLFPCTHTRTRAHAHTHTLHVVLKLLHCRPGI